MRGISEERLQEKFNEFFDNDDYSFEACAKSILDECTELNPWLPIADAPKDGREILIYYSGGIKEICQWINGDWCSTAHIDEYSGYPGQPTHYQELPEDPT